VDYEEIFGETPSHIIAPAVHKSKDDIADLFAEKHGRPRLDDIAALTHEAREILRQVDCLGAHQRVGQRKRLAAAKRAMLAQDCGQRFGGGENAGMRCEIAKMRSEFSKCRSLLSR
jgi:hypothetical protein